MSNLATFRPEWASPPNTTILQILRERNISDFEFSRIIDWGTVNPDALLNGTIEINDSIAELLTEALGASKNFWINRKQLYDTRLLELKTLIDDWLDELPLKDMIFEHWIEEKKSEYEIFLECLNFFDIPTVSAWREKYKGISKTVSFRTSQKFDSRTAAIAAWLRKGEIEASKIRKGEWSKNKLKESIDHLRRLTKSNDFTSSYKALSRICSECGISLILLKAPNGCRASGATWFQESGNPVILLSYRYNTLDQFWFSFFHEVGHLILHDKEELFIESEDSIINHREEEANEFAFCCLIPNEFKDEFFALKSSHTLVIRFAVRIGISPGIIVSLLQRHKVIPYSHLNKLKKYLPNLSSESY